MSDSCFITERSRHLCINFNCNHHMYYLPLFGTQKKVEEGHLGPLPSPTLMPLTHVGLFEITGMLNTYFLDSRGAHDMFFSIHLLSR